jgi:hypothetical protein
MLRPMRGVDKSCLPPDNPSLLVGRNWIERLLVSFIADHTPKCREVVKLLSQSMELRLPMSTQIKLRFHFLICVWCQRYERQLRALRNIAASAPEHLDQICPETLSDSSKERLKRTLRGREPW